MNVNGGDFEIDLESGRGPKALSNTPLPPANEQARLDPQAQTGPGPGRPESFMSKLDFRRSSHPVACVFHVLFKLVALVRYPRVTSYLTFGLMGVGDVVIFILVTVLLSCDFWTVKNVSGRLLVGLRWWTSVDAEGNEKWIFESFDHQVQNSPVDATIFWWSQIGATGAWCFFFFWKLLTFIQLGFFWVLYESPGRAHFSGRVLLGDEPLRLLQVQQR